jgi:hypothetical protein
LFLSAIAISAKVALKQAYKLSLPLTTSFRWRVVVRTISVIYKLYVVPVTSKKNITLILGSGVILISNFVCCLL